jgi:hypothetical protein
MAKYLRGAAGIGLGATFKYRTQFLRVEPELPSCVRKLNPHEHALPFASAAQNTIPTSKKKPASST